MYFVQYRIFVLIFRPTAVSVLPGECTHLNSADLSRFGDIERQKFGMESQLTWTNCVPDPSLDPDSPNSLTQQQTTSGLGNPFKLRSGSHDLRRYCVKRGISSHSSRGLLDPHPRMTTRQKRYFLNSFTKYKYCVFVECSSQQQADTAKATPAGSSHEMASSDELCGVEGELKIGPGEHVQPRGIAPQPQPSTFAFNTQTPNQWLLRREWRFAISLPNGA